MNNQSLRNRLYQGASEKQKKIVDKIFLTPERKQQKELLEKIDSSGYEISFRHKRNYDIINKATLRIRKTTDEHYGYINESVLKHKNSLFGYCYHSAPSKPDRCPNDFDNNILGFSQNQGWFIDNGTGNDTGKGYIIITSIELANKIFHI